MAVVNGVITDTGRDAIAKSIAYLGGATSFDLSYASYFKIGTSGYEVTPEGNVPIDPDPSFTDVQSVTLGTYYFTKALSASDFAFFSPSMMQIRCRLMPDESNTDTYTLDNPRFFEIGVFDQNDVMLFYATFDEQTKNVTKTLVIYIQTQF